MASTAHAQSWTEHVISGMYGPPSAAADSRIGGATPYRLHDAVPAGMPSARTWPSQTPTEEFAFLHARAQMKISGPDAPSAKALGSVGIDYKAIGRNGKSVNSYVVPAALSAAMKLLATDYQWVTATTMTPDEIRANPPPVPEAWGRATADAPTDAVSTSSDEPHQVRRTAH